MTRISLVEAYDDKDVITQIAKIKDKLDSIPDDADLSNCVLKVNNQIIDGRKTFNDVIVANDGIAVTGDLNVDGNIVQSGAAVEVHVEEVYTKNDYIVMREDAATAIPPGQFSGLQITKYNGVDDGRMVMDDSGIMRVGDVGNEQPLLTREESADLTDGALLKWDAANSKAVDEGTVGDDTHPVKIVGGVAVAVTNELQTKLSPTVLSDDGTLKIVRYGQLVIVSLNGYTPADVGARTLKTGLPSAAAYAVSALVKSTMTVDGALYIGEGTTTLIGNCATVTVYYGSLIYITNDP